MEGNFFFLGRIADDFFDTIPKFYPEVEGTKGGKFSAWQKQKRATTNFRELQFCPKNRERRRRDWITQLRVI